MRYFVSGTCVMRTTGAADHPITVAAGPFKSGQEAGQWAAEHNAETGFRGITVETLQAMRDWCADVFPDFDEEDRSDAEVIRAIRHHYDGGVGQFKRDGGAA